MKRIHILGTPIDSLTMQQTLDLVEDAIIHHKHIQHVVVNAAKIVSMQTDEQLRQSVTESDIINADGQAVVWASKLLQQPLPEKVSGIDLMHALVEMAHLKKYKIFLFGATEEIVKKVVEKYSETYDKNLIAGYRNGYYEAEEEAKIANQIADSKADILFIAISSPKKENFLHNFDPILKAVPFTMGVGGSFDVVAGKVQRSPVWMQHAGLEWLYRFIQEPRRMWKRYTVGNWKFIKLVWQAYHNLKKNNTQTIHH
ncbi:MAG: WecB/TagA/CpsF family glycosyltransferase [Verrucomicrobia bacterium]|nr:WecB/TagA/CpsF family glycosyltransferase [Cytophagales bacterium]